MTDISLDQLKNLLSELTIEDIEITNHYLMRARQRNINGRWITDCLISDKPLKTIKQDDNKFLLCYKHPRTPENLNLIIVIGIIISIKHITIITTYEQNVNVELRDYD